MRHVNVRSRYTLTLNYYNSNFARYSRKYMDVLLRELSRVSLDEAATIRRRAERIEPRYILIS